jgi:hypothetical protein
MPLCAPTVTFSARFTSVGPGAADAVGAQVRRLFVAAAAPEVSSQRRQAQRIAFPQLIRLQAVDPETLVPHDESTVVVGKFLSEQGLGFFHQEPMPHRFVVASIDVPGEPPARFLLDVSWCRFTRHGWYESGGRFLRVVE